MNDDELTGRLKSFYTKSDTTGFNYFDLLHVEGSPGAALFYSRLFWPEFAEIDGMVFLKETIEDESDMQRLKAAMERHGNNKIEVEKSFNLVEVPSLFGRRMDETSDEDDNLLAARIMQMWRHKLQEQFPKRSFSVSVVPPGESGGEVSILFHQK